MKVKRITANTATSDLKKVAAFYRDILGLDLIMDHGWFQTYGSDAKMTVQVSFGTEGGSGTPVPDLSIEVDDLEVALARFKKANVPIEYGPVSETWGVRRFYVRDPFGQLVNILQHEWTGVPPNEALQRRRPVVSSSSAAHFTGGGAELARSAK
jgi:catechol 2,3-dioxygenase-like lactoylglutathione lyase family enzyme